MTPIYTRGENSILTIVLIVLKMFSKEQSEVKVYDFQKTSKITLEQTSVNQGQVLSLINEARSQLLIPKASQAKTIFA